MVVREVAYFLPAAEAFSQGRARALEGVARETVSPVRVSVR